MGKTRWRRRNSERKNGYISCGSSSNKYRQLASKIRLATYKNSGPRSEEDFCSPTAPLLACVEWEEADD